MRRALTAICTATALAGLASAQHGPQTYRVEGLPDWAPFSSAVRAGDMLYVSGHLGRHPGTTDIVEGGAGPETAQTLANIETTLALAGATLQDLVSCTVYLTDIADYDAMNGAYAAALGGHQPARVTAGVQALALGARVEIACVAYLPEGAE
jgi:2-iminobutanoate/2-iminopropanoate deaminase